jgi:hypothetical protein
VVNIRIRSDGKTVGFHMVVKSRIRRRGKQSEKTWWKTVGLDGVVKVGLDVVLNSRIRLDGRQWD